MTDLEQQVRQMLPAKIDAVAYGLSLVHEDVRAARAALGRHDARFEGIEDALSSQAQILSSQTRARSNQSRMQREILRRLPE